MKRATLLTSLLFIVLLAANGQEKPELGKQNADGTYVMVDETATFQGGLASLYAFIGQNMKYPKQARKLGVEGRVFIEFIINESGEVINPKVIQGIGAGCDAEALRAFKAANQAWTPAKHKGQLVKQKMVLPVSFKLGKAKSDKEGKS
jgi:protein TonB